MLSLFPIEDIIQFILLIVFEHIIILNYRFMEVINHEQSKNELLQKI